MINTIWFCFYNGVQYFIIYYILSVGVQKKTPFSVFILYKIKIYIFQNIFVAE